MPRPKIALNWLASCGGCEETIVDIGLELLAELATATEIVFWPVALDGKREVLEALGSKELALAVVTGTVRTDEMVETLELLRDRAQLLVAVGACAHMGGIPSLANFNSRDELLHYAYLDAPTNDNVERVIPSQAPCGNGVASAPLSPLCERALPLHHFVDVDLTVPGCPPTPQLIKALIGAVLSGQVPPKGSVLGDSQVLCKTCPRLGTKPDELALERFLRPFRAPLAAETCLLAQGVLCVGPATRGGCGAQCVSANMPCRGCFGPPPEATDHAAAIVSMISAHAPVSGGEAGVREFVRSVVDVPGTLHRFGAASAMTLGHRHPGAPR